MAAKTIDGPRYLDLQQENSLYVDLFTEAFGVYNPSHQPSVVAVMERNAEITAFMSGYWKSLITFYIQYSAILPQYRHNFRALRWLHEGMAFMQNTTPVKAFMADVPNDNRVTLKLLLAAGFTIIGVRLDSGGTLQVEWLKVMEET